MQKLHAGQICVYVGSNATREPWVSLRGSVCIVHMLPIQIEEFDTIQVIFLGEVFPRGVYAHNLLPLQVNLSNLKKLVKGRQTKEFDTIEDVG